MKRIISILMLVCLMINSNSILAFAMTNQNKEIEDVSVSATDINTSSEATNTQNRYTPNTQEYVAEDGTNRTIYWAQGITPPKMTNDKSLQGKNEYFEKEVLPSSKGTSIVYQYPYEPGNGYYDLNKNTYRMGVESHLCYFGSALNLLYWWFGQNKDYINEYLNRLENTDIYSQPSGLKKILPYNKQLWNDMFEEPAINYVENVGYSQEIGTSKFAKNNLSYYFTRDKGFYTDAVIDYFINGYPCANDSDGSFANKPSEYKMDNTGGYFYPIFDKQMITERFQDGRATQYSYYSENLAKIFNEGKGVSIAYRIGGSTLAHAITVWGAEYNEDGNLVRIYVTDTDDYEYITNTKPDHLRGMHSMDAYPSKEGYMLIGNNVDNHNIGAKVYYIATMSLAKDKWEEVLNDPSKPMDAKITSQPQDELYPLGAQVRDTKVIAEPVDRSFLTYQWYECDINGQSPKKLVGQTTDTLKPDISKQGTKYYYCDVITNKNGHEHPTKSRIVKITVDPNIELTNAQKPGISWFNNYTIIHDINDSVSFSVNAWSNDGGTISYQWYQSLDSSYNNYWELKGQTGPSLKISTDKSAKKYYFCEITNTNDKATGTKVAKTRTGVKCIIIDASDRTVLNTILKTVKNLNSADYSNTSYQYLQNYYNAYKNYIDRGRTQAEVDLAASEIIMAYEALVPYLNLDLTYNNEGTVNVKYTNTNNYSKTNKVLFGEKVTLIANANNGYEFIGWYELDTKRILSTNSTFTFDMTSTQNIQPLFKKAGTSNLIFTNRTGQYIEIFNKSTTDWNSLNSIDALLPKIPFSYGYTNGRWEIDNNNILKTLRMGNDVVIAPRYDKVQADLPTVPTPNQNSPVIELNYRYNAKDNVGSFILASGIPKNCKVVSSGVLVSYGKKDTFTPSDNILTIKDKMQISQFTNSYTEPLNIVNVLKFYRSYNWAARGYLTYINNYGELKTVYSNQINIVDCKEV